MIAFLPLPVRTVVAVPSRVLPAYSRLTFGLPGRGRGRGRSAPGVLSMQSHTNRLELWSSTAEGCGSLICKCQRVPSRSCRTRQYPSSTLRHLPSSIAFVTTKVLCLWQLCRFSLSWAFQLVMVGLGRICTMPLVGGLLATAAVARRWRKF